MQTVSPMLYQHVGLLVLVKMEHPVFYVDQISP
jgi:hypothetical protein